MKGIEPLHTDYGLSVALPIELQYLVQNAFRSAELDKDIITVSYHWTIQPQRTLGKMIFGG